MRLTEPPDSLGCTPPICQADYFSCSDSLCGILGQPDAESTTRAGSSLAVRLRAAG